METHPLGVLTLHVKRGHRGPDGGKSGERQSEPELGDGPGEGFLSSTPTPCPIQESQKPGYPSAVQLLRTPVRFPESPFPLLSMGHESPSHP